MSKLYLKQTVHEAALQRMRRLFDEFRQIVVNISGGKDSTVILNLALQVAEERGRLPLPVLFLDQEAEWQHVITYIRTVMNDARVRPYWFQGPFQLFNATSAAQPWLYCWQDGADWIRPKEPNSIHENRTGVVRFHKLFAAFAAAYFPSAPCAYIAGVRCEESLGRRNGLTNAATYKEITWGTKLNPRSHHYTFYPIYDWSWRDVWKAIHDNGWSYCPLYDYQYQLGVPIKAMRVSNVHHETSIYSLRYLQEIEPDTWDRIVSRVAGVNAVSKVAEAYQCPRELPPMFGCWREYRDYLLCNLITDPGINRRFHARFAAEDRRYATVPDTLLVTMQIESLLINDYEGTKAANFSVRSGWFRPGYLK